MSEESTVYVTEPVAPTPSRTADVTVVMPAMNRAHLIGRALDSISRQTVRAREVIVIDDASSDETVAVARAAGATVIALEVNGGSGPARNRGIEAATTEWIAFLDSDDTWEPDHLERVLAHADGHVLVSAPGRSTGGRVIGNSWPREVSLTPIDLLAPGELVCTSGTIVRRRALLAAGGFRPLRRAQDLDMWVRVMEHGEGVALPTPSFTYYLHEEQAILDTSLMRRCYEEIVESCKDRPWFETGDDDRALAKWHWDDLRAAQRDRQVRDLLQETWWVARRPHVWPVVAKLLRHRRLNRRT